MTKKLSLINEVQKLTDPMKLIVLIIELPTGALETIINSTELENKLEYVINAYDDDLKLKTNTNIRIAAYNIL